MRKILILLPAALLFLGSAFAQSIVPGVDYPSPIPVPFVGFTTGVNPARCVPGKSPLNFQTSNSTYYYCSARNVWTAVKSTAYFCGTAAACSPTTKRLDWEFVGSVALASGTPSTATITGLSPAYTSSSSYTCTATPTGATAAIAAAGVAITYVSGSSFTLTGPNTVTTVLNYRCRGN